MATKGKPEGLVGLSVAEAKVLLLGILCTDNTGKLDGDRLAAKGNYKNGASAKTMHRVARKALFERNLGEDEASPSATTADTTAPADGTAAPAPTPKKTPTKRRKKDVAAAETGLNGDTEDEIVTPKPKRQRKTPVKKAGASTPAPNIETGNSGVPPMTSNPHNKGIKVEDDTSALTSSHPALKLEDSDSTTTSELIVKGAMDDGDAIMTNAELDAELNHLGDDARVAIKMEDIEHGVDL
ncbi:hypothetical protein P168DRAFT_40466 [Aspergillus campestris IBT 28561]|uniref:Histone h1.3 n=1 Tax=Aspergillus campestris (strain IBT 28561) TaxID=1392248 RepID=A0A2I1CWR9_ASPC2|nr:uncharacterized protein P168DRAFT_40466 [Aspergillus campestris IBT 28561]PKY02069.1 hypothetical protein P168DRAFT_40466 [Aspergillus campestris IBT 28561]